MSNIHLYSDEVLWNVNEVLCHIRDNGGKATSAFWMKEAKRLQGQWGADVVNIARQAMGREGLFFEGKASEKQMVIFVEKAKQDCALVLRDIKKLREAQEGQ